MLARVQAPVRARSRINRTMNNVLIQFAGENTRVGLSWVGSSQEVFSSDSHRSGRIRSGGLSNLTGRVGSGQDVFEISRVGLSGQEVFKIS